jgi:predicted TIM-barrel fold metal-dependent hydrolase
MNRRFPASHEPNQDLSRRQFIRASGAALIVAAASGCSICCPAGARAEPIIDIHQHVAYSGRPDDVLLTHQRAMGITTTILLPSGRPVNRASTHDGKSNGLAAQTHGNEACHQFAKAHPKEFLFAANEVPDLEDATQEIEKYLKLGAVMIAEQKFGVECDSAEMQKVYRLAQAYRVPVLMHWQFNMYNHGFERFYKMLEKYPKVNFIGHAQTWWANIDKSYHDQTVLYPKTRPITPGGITDRYLADYANMFGDLSAGSGLNALTRDEDFTRRFLKRHQDKLLFGSDCNDHIGAGEKCQGARTIATIRRLADSKKIERKLLCENAKKLLGL